jgi:hypothetical protein
LSGLRNHCAFAIIYHVYNSMSKTKPPGGGSVF